MVLSIAPQPVFSLWNKYSSFSKLVWIVAYCLRFLFHCKFPVSQTIPMSIELFYAEIANAKELLYHFSQLMYFCQDYSTLKSGKTLSKSSSLHSLNPFIDQSNLIRVGGRLGNLKLDFFTKYLIVLHKTCPIVNLLIRQIHIDHEHASPNVMMSILLERFYIVGAKSIVRKISRNCSICQRVYSHSMQQQMGNLPINRTNITAICIYMSRHGWPILC